MTITSATRPWWDKLTPRAGVRVQMFSAALLWLVGVSFLLVRGVLFVERPESGSHFSYWIAPIALAAIAIGAVKARFILIRYATKAVARIQKRGRACYFGFFAPTSWLFVIVMMGGGVMLRHSALVYYAWGRAGLATLYIAVGTGLGDRRPHLLDRRAATPAGDRGDVGRSVLKSRAAGGPALPPAAGGLGGSGGASRTRVPRRHGSRPGRSCLLTLGSAPPPRARLPPASGRRSTRRASRDHRRLTAEPSCRWSEATPIAQRLPKAQEATRMSRGTQRQTVRAGPACAAAPWCWLSRP